MRRERNDEVGKWKAKTSLFPLDTFSSDARLRPGKRRHLPPLSFDINEKNDALCHLRTITHDGKTSIDGSETFPSKGEKELGSPQESHHANIQSIFRVD